MKCVICKSGDVSKNRTTLTFEKNGTTMILKNVPCEKCEQCGEVYLGQETTKEVMALVEKLSQSGGEVSIYKFKAA